MQKIKASLRSAHQGHGQSGTFVCSRSWALITSFILIGSHISEAQNAEAPEIRTPKPPLTPRINGPSVFGVRPGHPFLYQIPATGERPMTFSVAKLPSGLKLDSKTGQIIGALKKNGEFSVVLKAKNSKGSAEKKFRI